MAYRLLRREQELVYWGWYAGLSIISGACRQVATLRTLGSARYQYRSLLRMLFTTHRNQRTLTERIDPIFVP